MTTGLTWARAPTLTCAYVCMHVAHTLHLKSILEVKRVQGYSGLHSKLLSPKTKTSLYLLLTICAGFFIFIFYFLFSTEVIEGEVKKRGRMG